MIVDAGEGPDRDKKSISDDLKKIVDEFNSKFQGWMKETGCRANFGWKYGDHDALKQLEVQSIDLIVYRKPPPDLPSAVKMDRDV